MANIGDEQALKLLLRAQKRLEGNSSSPSQSDDNQIITARPLSTPRETSVRTVAQPEKTTKTKDNAGSNWFGLPKTVATTEMKRDWQLLRMRSVLDPTHQKKALRAELPKYSQTGEIIAGPTDFFSGRLTRREKRQSIAGEIMRDYQKEKFSAKYAGIQKSKMSGKRAFYKQVVAKRRKGSS